MVAHLARIRDQVLRVSGESRCRLPTGQTLGAFNEPLLFARGNAPRCAHRGTTNHIRWAHSSAAAFDTSLSRVHRQRARLTAGQMDARTCVREEKSGTKRREYFFHLARILALSIAVAFENGLPLSESRIRCTTSLSGFTTPLQCPSYGSLSAFSFVSVTAISIAGRQSRISDIGGSFARVCI